VSSTIVRFTNFSNEEIPTEFVGIMGFLCYLAMVIHLRPDSLPRAAPWTLYVTRTELIHLERRHRSSRWMASE